MKVRTKVTVDREDGSAPVTHEIWRAITDADVREFTYPEEPFGSPADLSTWHEWKRYDGQLHRHREFVKLISLEVAAALGRALGNRPEHG